MSKRMSIDEYRDKLFSEDKKDFNHSSKLPKMNFGELYIKNLTKELDYLLAFWMKCDCENCKKTGMKLPSEGFPTTMSLLDDMKRKRRDDDKMYNLALSNHQINHILDWFNNYTETVGTTDCEDEIAELFGTIVGYFELKVLRGS